MGVAVPTAVPAFTVQRLPPVDAASLVRAGPLTAAYNNSIDWAQWRRRGAVHRGFVARGPRGGGCGREAHRRACGNGRPPAPGYCSYDTNPQPAQGFWDVCSR